MPTNTLTSLAILKVNIDQGRDYLDYLKPFIFQVLMDYNPDPITGSNVSGHIREQFGLEIPVLTIEALLRRLSRQYPINRVAGVYMKVGDLPDPQLIAKQAEAERHIGAVINGLKQFSQETAKPIVTDAEAVTSVSAFLTEFSIMCLRAYLRGTAIPGVEGSHQSDIVLISDYVQNIQRMDPERFESFLVLVQGHMLANALMCPDLANAPTNFRNVTFYLDTPLLVQILGSEGEPRQTAIRELITLVNSLGGKVATFAHSMDELERVLIGAANHLESPDARGTIVIEAKKRGTTKSDLLLLASSIDESITRAGIEVESTPAYIEAFQIDEAVFQQILEDEVSYYNPRAKEYDINSVRSIYVNRGDKPAQSIEKSRATLVTSNTGFARAAWDYGQQFDVSRNVSSVISDFTLANIAWLKAPIGAATVPITQLLAFSYAALEPSRELLNRYLKEIDRLERLGTISERDHQLLRSSPFVYSELMHFTLGHEASLTQETVEETLERVSDEIKKEESRKLSAEQLAHRETEDALKSQESLNREILRGLYWRCRGKARLFAWGVSIVLTGLLATALVFGLGTLPVPRLPVHAVASWIIRASLVVLALASLTKFVAGYTIKDFHLWVEGRFGTWLLKREAKSLGIDLNELHVD